MVSEMSFSPDQKKFLLDNGKIYTVRKYAISDSDVKVSNIGICSRKPLGIIVQSDLDKYVRESGFDTVEDWLHMINRLISVGNTMFLYEVTLDRKFSRNKKRLY